MRLASTLLAVVVLTALAGMLVQGDGPGSHGTILVFSRHHGLNLGDLPVLVLWLVGVLAVAGLARRGRD